MEISENVIVQIKIHWMKNYVCSFSGDEILILNNYESLWIDELLKIYKASEIHKNEEHNHWR